MTGPAKMRHAGAGIFVLSFVVTVGFVVWWINGKMLPRPSREWSSQHLADPVELTVGEATIRVSRFVLDFDRELLTLEQDELTFNDYGDATRIGGQEPLRIPVRLCREATNRFEIALQSGFKQRFRLVVSPPPANTHRLIVLGESSGRWDLAPERILELRSSEVVPDELGDSPQPERFHFDTLGYGPRGGEGHLRFYGIGVSGSLANSGQLSIDPNFYSFHPDGSVGRTTCLGWSPIAVKFQSLGPDPANRGRRAFEVLPGKTKKDPMETWGSKSPDITGEYVLVLGPTELSEHRLLIKDKGTVKQVLRLQNKNRDNHLSMLKKLDKVPADEREAFKELGRVGGYRVTVEAHEGHVRSLNLLEGDLAKFDPILARFPDLRSVIFMDATLPASGLPSLERLKVLHSVSFYSSELSDDGLASIGRATWLKRLTVYGSKGHTVAGLARLAPLTCLEMLEIRNEDQQTEGLLFDEGLKHLSGMTRLTHLNLTGQQLTDMGLPHIGRLNNLRHLYISGNGLTDVGLKHLEGLTQLEQLTVYPRISPTALAELRAKLPNLRKSP